VGDSDGRHAAPPSALSRWQETEPIRLYLYGITVPLLGAAVAYGWMTTEQLGAWLAVAGALFLGSTLAGELARRRAWAPHTVDDALDEQHRESYAMGVQDAVHHARTPETVAMEQVTSGRCRDVTGGRRCVLQRHGEETPHHYV
jgi:hypothetical protein